MGELWPSSCVINGVTSIECLPVIFRNVANAFLLFAGTVALFLFVWSGIRLIISGGDAKQVQSARQTMTYAIIGLIVVLSSFSIVLFIGYVTGTSNCITDVNSIIKGCQ